MTRRPSILIGFDEQTSMDELDPVVEMVKATGWKVHLLYVTAPDLADVEGVGDGSEASDEPAERLAACVDRLLDDGIDAEPHVIDGPVIETILGCADEWQAETIVVVGRTHPVGDRAALGSTASALLRIADRPVLVIPAVAVADRGLLAEQGYRSSLEQLVELLERTGAENRAELRAALDEGLSEPVAPDRQPHLGRRLKKALEQFETDHPSLIRVVNDVSYYLSGMGI